MPLKISILSSVVLTTDGDKMWCNKYSA